MLAWPPCRNKTMILSRRHMSVTLFIAVLLHMGLAVWFSLPTPEPKSEQIPPLRINLLASIADTSVNAAAATVKPPTPVKEKPQPVKQKIPMPPKPVEPLLAEAESIKSLPEPMSEIIEQPAKPVAAQPVAPALDAIATARYEQLLVAWLEKHKKYPSRAKRLRIEGEGMLRILIDRSGRTRQVSLEQRTGNRFLDKAALDMARRANPFPPIPNNDPRHELEFIVPVAFVLR